MSDLCWSLRNICDERRFARSPGGNIADADRPRAERRRFEHAFAVKRIAKIGEFSVNPA